jgi:hypothetical protein
MALDRTLLETFFANQWDEFDQLREMRFSACGMNYQLWLVEERNWLFFKVDPVNTDVAFPALEFGFRCDRLREATAAGVGPVLLFYSGETVRLAVTKTSAGCFSLSPNWTDEPPGQSQSSRPPGPPPSSRHVRRNF